MAALAAALLLIGVGTALNLRAEEAVPSKPPITALAFAPDGMSFVVGSQAGIEVRAWPTLKPIRSLPAGLAHVHDLAFSPDGKTLAAAGGSPGEKGEVEWYSWPEGKSQRRLAPHDDLIHRLAWNAGGEKLAFASADHSVSLYSGGNDKPVKLSGHSRAVLAVVFLSDDKTLVSAGVDQSLRVWNLSDGKLLRTLDNHTAAIHDLAIRPGVSEGPPQVASAGADRTVRLWQPTIGRLMRFVRLPSAPLALAWTSDGSHLICSCTDGGVRVLNPDTVQIASEHIALSGWAYSLAVSPDNLFAVVGGPDGKIKAVSIGTSIR